MQGYIYKTTNLVNNTIYVGKHSSRYFSPSYLGRGRYIKDAILCYGKKNFSVELIEWCDSLQTLNEREKYWISYYHNAGCAMYNIAPGGDGGNITLWMTDSDKAIVRDNIRSANIKNHQLYKDSFKRGCIKAWETRRKLGKDKLSPTHIQKLRNSNIGKKISKETIAKRVNSREGYRHSEDTKKKISISNLGKHRTDAQREHMSSTRKGKYCGEANPFYGKTHSESAKQKIGSYNAERFAGRIWINNGIENKRVLFDQFENYALLGYTKGRIKWGKH